MSNDRCPECHRRPEVGHKMTCGDPGIRELVRKLTGQSEEVTE